MHGRKQARFVAKRFESIPIDVIVSSYMLRAKQTAAEIAEVTNRNMIESQLFHEVMRPSKLWGKLYTDPSIKEDMVFMHANFGNQEVRHSDEENFFDLRTRAGLALAFLRARPEKQIAVTTHGFFLKMLIAVMMHGEEIGYLTFNFTLDFLEPKNTGITTCHFDKDGNARWTLVTWDDHAHLGEIKE